MLLRGVGLLGCLAAFVISSPVPASAGGIYFVQAGDTLTDISRMFGVPIGRMRAANHLITADIKPGDRLRIPDVAPEPKPIVTVAIPSEASAGRVLPAVSSKPDPLFEQAPSRELGTDPLPLALATNPDSLTGIPQRREVSSERVLQALCRDETVYHAIVKGDTLYSLAIRYATELEKLLQLNGLRKNSRLSIGQRIVVRKSGPRTHTVDRRETLARIASRYGIQAETIALLNHLDGDKIPMPLPGALPPRSPARIQQRPAA
jgi:LysM repeat protein